MVAQDCWAGVKWVMRDNIGVLTAARPCAIGPCPVTTNKGPLNEPPKIKQQIGRNKLMGIGLVIR